ncbi:hypothetical protein N0V91_000517 [Didymella pomorum]|uniref:Uncharacterized protein n=1 Tax=Didymella pomorum TaxID=749634 RepID=A0A9W8ZMM5_9PLEO|nr:hypothetical protein N0V91_000517 [Didymella pomorum]
MKDEWIEKDAMRVFCDWLYTGTIHIDKSVPRDSEDFGLCILKAHTFATQLDDTSFRNAVYVFEELQEEDEDDEEDDSDDDINDDTDAPGYEIDVFVIDAFMEAMDSRTFSAARKHVS